MVLTHDGPIQRFLQGIFHDTPHHTINVKQENYSTASLCPSEHQRCIGRLESYVLQAIWDVTDVLASYGLLVFMFTRLNLVIRKILHYFLKYMPLMNHNSFRYGTTLQQTYNYILETIFNGSNSRRTNTTLPSRCIS